MKVGGLGSIHHDGTTEIRTLSETGPVVDTTGAGDAYCAGYLAAMVAGADVRGSMTAGARAAATAIASMGARPI
jgi:sugar/nucleoside kinase (ribokinase family)